jgi:hypothetical protein
VGVLLVYSGLLVGLVGIAGSVDFKEFDRPGYVKVAMNFHLAEIAGGCRVSTETRVLATDSSARWKFAVYWRIIYPGSALIRRMWLAAIKRRAEAVSSDSAL